MKTERDIRIAFTQYSSISELPEELKGIAQSAIEAASSAYAPYSGLSVGAAALMSGGATVCGSNQENAAFPSGVCAEKTTLGTAFSSYPEQALCAIAVAALRNGELTESPITPCGSCRDALSEAEKRSGHPVKVLCVGRNSVYLVEGLRNLLPLGFSLE